MWRFVLIFSQILVLVIGEDVAESNDSPLKVRLTETVRPLVNKNDREHLRNRRSLKSDAAVKNIISAFEEMARPQQNQVVEVVCGGNYLPRVHLHSHLALAGSIHIGHPKTQQFTVIFDTGSSDIWIPSVDSHIDNPVHQMKRKYNSSQSDSHKEDGRLFRASYSSGAVNGFTSIDHIEVADLVIENQIFVEATDLPKAIFPYSNIDGIFGLGFKSLSRSSPKKTPLDRLKDQNVIKNRVFCFHMKNNQKDNIEVALFIGGCDMKAKFYLPIKKSGYWQFHMTSIHVIHHEKKSNQKKVLTTGCNGGCDVILDTGSTDISGPHDEIVKINNVLGAEYDKEHNHFSIQCEKTDLPDVIFNFGDNQITLAPKDYIIQVQPRNCVSGFNVLTGISGPIQYVFGGVILRRVISIHDMEKERIGFAVREH